VRQGPSAPEEGVDILGGALASQRMFTDLIDTPASVLGPGLILRDLNAAGARLLGGEREGLIGTSGLMHVPGDFAKRYIEQLNAVFESGRGRVFAAFFNGVYFAMHLTPVADGPDALAATWFRRAVVGTEPDNHDGELERVELGAHYLGPIEGMTARELSVLRLLGLGRTSRDIGTLLHRSPRTIESNVITIGRKLGVTTRVEMARAAIHAGLAGADEVPAEAPVLGESYFKDLLAAGG